MTYIMLNSGHVVIEDEFIVVCVSGYNSNLLLDCTRCNLLSSAHRIKREQNILNLIWRFTGIQTDTV